MINVESVCTVALWGGLGFEKYPSTVNTNFALQQVWRLLHLVLYDEVSVSSLVSSQAGLSAEEPEQACTCPRLA